jgi:hypothetical protein
MTEGLAVLKTFEGTPTLTPEKVRDLKKHYELMVETYNRSGFAYFDGYAQGLEEALKVLHEEVGKAAEAAKGGSFKRVVFVGVCVTGYVLYKRHQNGVLFPKKDEKDG